MTICNTVSFSDLDLNSQIIIFVSILTTFKASLAKSVKNTVEKVFVTGSIGQKR
jgi:hypothetical protein